jgi:PPOX class probable F420-dependent enzyme
VCFGLIGDTLYIAIDAKPKRERVRPLKRLSNIADNPRVAVVFDHYDEDWRRLAWVMLRGRADVLTPGEEHARAQALVRSRYPQLVAMPIESLPVIAIRIERVTSWGDLGG